MAGIVELVSDQLQIDVLAGARPTFGSAHQKLHLAGLAWFYGCKMEKMAAANLRFAAIAVGAVAATSVIGQVATYPNLEPWYAGLLKPTFTPPNWVFAPVWTSLYALMAFAFWRILRTPDTSRRRTAIMLFALLLVANAAWSWMFFGANSPILGLINIGPQLGIIGATIASFWILDRLASLSLLPLAMWVAFAAVLNFSIWRLNG